MFFFCRIQYRPVVADMDSSCIQLWRLMLCWSSYWNGSGTCSHTDCRESEVHRVGHHDLLPRSRRPALHHDQRFVDPWNSSLSMAPVLGCAVAAPRRCHFNRVCIRRCPGHWSASSVHLVCCSLLASRTLQLPWISRKVDWIGAFGWCSRVWLS